MNRLNGSRWSGRWQSRYLARIAGSFYLLIFIVAPSGAATATRANIMATLACDVTVALLFYSLFKPISRRLALASSLFRIAFVFVMAVNSLFYFGIVRGVAIARTPEAVFDLGYGISLVPFGVHCLLCGILIVRSVFLPRLVGFLMVVTGLAYLLFLWPPLGQRLFFPYIVVPAILGEGSLTLWLLIMGVNAGQWAKQQSCAEECAISRNSKSSGTHSDT